MCGIAGYVLARGRADQETVERMCDQIRYRGPDDSGYYVNGRAAIGMRRLSIIDLAGGHQPIPNEDQTLWVVYNGEVYNYQELHRDLVSRGHQFTTHSDTETLLHLHEEEGVSGLPRLRGMFAYALWDSRREELLLVRDRFGKKPLYYSPHFERLVLRQRDQVPARRRHSTAYRSGSIETIFSAGLYSRTIFRIPDRAQTRPRLLAAVSRRRHRGQRTLLEHARAGVSRSCGFLARRHLPAPPPDLRRSGEDAPDRGRPSRRVSERRYRFEHGSGVDGAPVSDPVKTFSIGFEESEYNELQYASLLARRYNTDHHELMVRPDSVSLVEKLVHHFDEPFADSAAIPTYLVSEFAAQHVKVALSGDGGDELFGGYTRFQAIEPLLFMDRVPSFLRSGLAALAGWLPFSAYGKNYLHMLSRSCPMDRYIREQLLQLLSAQAIAATGMDAPGRLRIPDANVAGRFSAQDSGPRFAGPVLRDRREPARRHAAEGGPYVHGGFARSALPPARSRSG